MQDSFLKHFAIIGGGTLINMLLGVITTPIVTRIVDPIEYGQLSIFTMYSNIAIMVLCFGLDQSLVRYYYEKEDEAYQRSLLFRCIKLPVLASTVLSCLMLYLENRAFISFEFNTCFTSLLCLYTVIQILYRFSLLLVRLAYKSKLYAGLNIIHKLIYIFSALPLIILWGNDNLLSLIFATILAALVCLIISMMAQKNLWNISKYKASDCHMANQELLKYSYPYVFTMGITTLFQAIDKISLNIYCSYNEVGIYSSAMTLINVFAVIQTTFNSLWAPMSVEHYTKDKEDKEFYQKGNQIITFIMFFLGLTLILCKDIFAMLLGEEYREAARILPFLIFNPIMYTISETTVCGIVFMKKSKLQVVVATGACIANIIGNTILVPRYGCQGAAIATGISYIIFFTLRTIFSNMYFYVNYNLRKFYLLTFSTILYAFYNTFCELEFGSVFGYAICLIILFTFYNKTMKWIAIYIKNLLLSLFEKQLHMNVK